MNYFLTNLFQFAVAGDKILCEFCLQVFDTIAAKAIHILDHFQQEICQKCDQKLLRIGENLYVLHSTITCIDTRIKQESELTDGDEIAGIFNEESENLVEIDKDDLFKNETENDFNEEENIKTDVTEAICVGNLSVQKDGPTKSLNKPKISKQVGREKETNRKRGRPRKCREIAEKPIKIDSKQIFDDDSCEDFKKGLESSPPVAKKRGRRRKKETFFKCEHKGCGKIVKNRCKAAHIKTHLKQRFECDICHTSLASKLGLRAHFDVHYPRREFKCHICPAEYKSLSSLNQHIRYIHENEPKQFICTICGSAQRKKHLLWEHMNRHNGVKPYACTYDGCEMRFFSKARRTEHGRAHTGEKPFCCPIDGCDSRFAYAVDFKRHKFKAHGIYTKKYNCTICAEVLPENRLLKKHMETHHKQIG